MAEHVYELYTRLSVPPFSRTGVIRNYAKFGYTKRYQAAGEFALQLTGEEAPELARTLPGNLFEVTRDGATDFLGFFRGVRFTYDQQAPASNAPDLKGWDLAGWLLHRRCAIPPPPLQYYGNSGVAETVMKQGVADHFSSPSDANRKITFIEIEPDQQRGAPVVVNLRGEKWDDSMSKIAVAGSVGFRIGLDAAANLLQFQVYQGSTSSVIFTPDYHNLTAFTYEEDLTDLENHVYTMGGDGSTLARFTVEDENAASVTTWGRWEATQDASNAYNTSIAHTQGGFYLAPKANVQRVSFIPRETAQSQYNNDWFLGDSVRVRYDKWGVDLTAPIVQVEVSVEAGRGEEIQTTINLLPSDVIRKLRAMAQAVQPQLFAPQQAALVDGRVEFVNLASAPVIPTGYPPARPGQTYFDTGQGTLMFYGTDNLWHPLTHT